MGRHEKKNERSWLEIAEKSIAPHDLQNFFEWAFGLEYFTFCHNKDFVDAWNKRHGLEFRITLHEEMCCDVDDILHLWKKKRNHVEEKKKLC